MTNYVTNLSGIASNMLSVTATNCVPTNLCAASRPSGSNIFQIVFADGGCSFVDTDVKIVVGMCSVATAYISLLFAKHLARRWRQRHRAEVIALSLLHVVLCLWVVQVTQLELVRQYRAIMGGFTSYGIICRDPSVLIAPLVGILTFAITIISWKNEPKQSSTNSMPGAESRQEFQGR